MIELPRPRGWAIFCDEARHEIDGRFSFMGVIPGAIVTKLPFPITLSRLAIVAFYQEYLTDPDQGVAFEVSLASSSKRKTIHVTEVPAGWKNTGRPSPFSSALAEELALTKMGKTYMMLMLENYVIEEESIVRVAAKVGDNITWLSALTISEYSQLEAGS